MAQGTPSSAAVEYQGPPATGSPSLNSPTIQHINLPTGAAATAGTATLVAGTVTVNTTAVTANSIIVATCKIVGGTQGILQISAQTAGTSFVITSSNVADTSTVNWILVN